VWTVNDEPEMRRVIGLGVDVLTSDRPDVALRVLGR
jgi:glycerophosphoryl diester phosphodiesterase